MERREFLKTTAATATVLAAQGHLPLLAAQKKRRPAAYSGPSNCATEPCAIEPVTGHLRGFSPATGQGMSQLFSAQYDLVQCGGSAQTARNSIGGALAVSFAHGRCRTVETRRGHGGPGSVVKAMVRVKGDLHVTSKWTLESRVDGREDLTFTERGTWDGKTMSVTSDAWTHQQATTGPVIARWTLLPLLASGRLKTQPLAFDMLDDSTLRPGQTLRYEGEIDVPVKGGAVKLDSYAQTGQGIVPTHYLADGEGRVQLITMSTVNWALKSCQ